MLELTTPKPINLKKVNHSVVFSDIEEKLNLVLKEPLNYTNELFSFALDNIGYSAKQLSINYQNWFFKNHPKKTIKRKL